MGDQNTKDDQLLDLSGARVLLVEDEYFIADDLRRVLEAAGATVIGPVSTIDKANVALDEGGFDCAVLDLNLHGESAAGIADRLVEGKKPFAFATGYGSSALPGRFDGVPRIEKPFDPPALLRLIGQLNRVEAA